jgi:hypothetical protein
VNFLLIQDFDAQDIPLLPTLLVSREQCGCCEANSISLSLVWLFWGIGLSCHID